ncbi:MAG: hypothetical protein M3065_17580 [Actinomycetota bacterium]|nr:hypothetical protein [Actinomycetota bacterium]
MPSRTSPLGLALATATIATAVLLAGCGLGVQSPDLFGLTRTGGGKPLIMVVNDGGTIRCDGGPSKKLPDRLLVVARSLVGQLDPDARKKLDAPSARGSVYRFKVSLQKGTFSFPDTAATHRPELAKLEQFVLQAEPSCRARG